MNKVANLKLDFEDKTIGNLYITPDWVKWLFTSPIDKVNVTVIKFSMAALSILSRIKYERLAPADPVENEDLSVFQYRQEILNFGKGRINKVISEYSNRI